MAAPSSADTSPSHTANNAPTTHPNMACGPPIALTTSGMVMNGPTPIMSIMLSAVALPSPIPRMRPGELADDSVGDPMRRLDQPRKNDWNGTRQLETGNHRLATGNRQQATASHSANSHTTAPLPAHRPAVGGRRRIPCRYKFPCHTSLSTAHPSAHLHPDHDS